MSTHQHTTTPALAASQPALTAEEQAKLTSRVNDLQRDNEAYIRAHPELADMCRGFVKAALEAKPDNVVEFAVQYFGAGGEAGGRGAAQDGKSGGR
jgi:hypothetical protein